jgi:CheY-like chemotaxis protein
MKSYQSTILVVEDDAHDREVIKTVFKGFGVTDSLHMVNDGVEAIDYMMGEGPYSDRVQHPYPTFIMTDLKMPRASGFELLHHIKSNPAFAVIPTVVLSASEDPDDIRTSYMLGASSYHVKPQTLDGLRAQLKILHDYWLTCSVPEVDVSGAQVRTDARGKLGEKFPQLSERKQSRVG